MADKTLSPDDVEAKRAKRRAYRAAHRDEINARRRTPEARVKRQQHRTQPETREREREQENTRRQKPEVKAATAAATKARREANLEEEREYERLQQARRREDPVIRARMREQDTASYQRHRDKRLESKRQERLVDPEKLHERDRNRNPEKRKASHKAYRLRNREKLIKRKLKRIESAKRPILSTNFAKFYAIDTIKPFVAIPRQGTPSAISDALSSSLKLILNPYSRMACRGKITVMILGMWTIKRRYHPTI